MKIELTKCLDEDHKRQCHIMKLTGFFKYLPFYLYEFNQKHSIRFKLTDSYIINCANLSLNSLFSLCCYYKLQQYNDKNTNVSKIFSSEKTTPLRKIMSWNLVALLRNTQKQAMIYVVICVFISISFVWLNWYMYRY